MAGNLPKIRKNSSTSEKGQYEKHAEKLGPETFRRKENKEEYTGVKKISTK